MAVAFNCMRACSGDSGAKKRVSRIALSMPQFVAPSSSAAQLVIRVSSRAQHKLFSRYNVMLDLGSFRSVLASLNMRPCSHSALSRLFA